MQDVYDSICTLIGTAFPEAKIYFTGTDTSVQVSINDAPPKAKVYLTGNQDGFDIPSMIVSLTGYKLSDLNKFMSSEKLSFKITQHFYPNFLDRVRGRQQIERFVKLRELFRDGVSVSNGTRADLESLEAGMNQQDMFLILHLERTLQKQVNESGDIMRTLEYNQKMV